VKGQGHTLVQVCGDEDIHVDAGASESILYSLYFHRMLCFFGVFLILHCAFITVKVATLMRCMAACYLWL